VPNEAAPVEEIYCFPNIESKVFEFVFTIVLTKKWIFSRLSFPVFSSKQINVVCPAFAPWDGRPL